MSYGRSADDDNTGDGRRAQGARDPGRPFATCSPIWHTAAPTRPAAPVNPAAPAQPPPAAAGETPWITQLQKLAQLHEQGVLSDADYEAAKRRVLEQS